MTFCHILIRVSCDEAEADIIIIALDLLPTSTVWVVLFMSESETKHNADYRVTAENLNN